MVNWKPCQGSQNQTVTIISGIWKEVNSTTTMKNVSSKQ